MYSRIYRGVLVHFSYTTICTAGYTGVLVHFSYTTICTAGYTGVLVHFSYSTKCTVGYTGVQDTLVIQHMYSRIYRSTTTSTPVLFSYLFMDVVNFTTKFVSKKYVR